MDRRRPGPPPVPLGPRPAPEPARRDPRLPGPRRRLRVRQEPVDRRRVDHRRAAAHELRAGADDRGPVRRGRHARPVRRPAVLRVRGEREPRRPRAARRRAGHPAPRHRRRAPPPGRRRGRDRRTSGRALRLRAPPRVDQRRARRPVRRIRRRRAAPGRRRHPRHRRRARERGPDPLARIGFDHVIGALDDIDGVLTARPELAAQAPRVTAAELEAWRRDDPSLQIVDVRNPAECAGRDHRGIPEPAAPDPARPARRARPSRPTVVYCAGGYRSATAASLLRARGFATVADLLGGYAATTSPRPATT